ncbi:MAG: menaquinone biosynthesis decarboxylase [Chloroflexi bacterium]|nr:menaquinone biosynthesis decarboxylase [Chloroflexota bacterium]
MPTNGTSAQDLRTWIELLRREGELIDVKAQVDPFLEITEIVDRTIRTGGPALLFHHPRKSAHPLLINQFGTERRMCLAFGEPNLDAVARKLHEMTSLQPPQNFSEQMRGMGKLRRLLDTQPQLVSKGPCQELVLEPNLDLLPIQHCWPDDPAPFITLPAVITKNPRTGERNLGMYRMQKIDAQTTFMHWQIHKDGATDWRGMSERLDVAVALGCDPITTYLATVPFPRNVDELVIAGYLRGAPLELVKAKTVDLEVPASAEIILEGYITRGELGIEGPFGDHTGYYSAAEPFPVFHLTCMTMRRDAIYPSIIVGLPPAEDAWLGKTTERLFLPMLRMSMPEVVDYDLPVAGAFQHCAIVSVKKAYPGHAKKVIHAIWGMGLLSLIKSVVVVDEFINVHNYEQVFFQVCANVDPKRDILLSEGPLDQLDHSAVLYCYGGKLGIDATHKWTSEGVREWPKRIEMSAEVRNLVDQRWDEYGIGAAAGQDELPPDGIRRGLF